MRARIAMGWIEPEPETEPEPEAEGEAAEGEESAGDVFADAAPVEAQADEDAPAEA